MKKWVQSKTMWLGVAVGVLAVLQSTLASAPLDPSVQGLITGGIGVAIVWLRKLTTTAIG